MFSELLPSLLTAGLGFPPALVVRQVLAIDMGTDILPALALGSEKPEPDIMKYPPRLPSRFWTGDCSPGLSYGWGFAGGRVMLYCLSCYLPFLQENGQGLLGLITHS